MNDILEDGVMSGSLFDLFTQTSETIEDAKKKNASESSVKTQYYQMTNDGTYAIRILPLAPVVDATGNIVPSRKGYEYPHKDLFLKIQGTDKNGKVSYRNIPVVHTGLAFPNLKNDLIELYVRLACEANQDDKEFVDKISGNSFNGGLKYNAKRCMYVLDTDDRAKGPQILQLSFSQYKELEDTKLRLWQKLIQKNPKTPCPISSPHAAFPVEITRKTEKKKVSYSIAIDTIGGQDELTKDELQALFDAPRLPEVLYVYRRFHLEATIEFLRQMDELYSLNIMDSEEIKDCIDQIKMCLPADDQSHFNFHNDNSDKGEGKNVKLTLDQLWDMQDELNEQGLSDRTDEGQNLRTLIREFIDENKLDVRFGRTKTNEAMLKELTDLMENGVVEDEPEDDDEPSVPEVKDEPVIDEDDDSSERGRNDDTNEPAVKPERRSISRNIRRGR